ncbi:MAG: pyridoxal-phosphate-dependent aminotransferase family protein [Candidatus Hadarchaeia archaeon]
MEHNKLFLPGPTEVRKDIIEEMDQWTFGHRSETMTDLYTAIVEDTKEFFDTDYHVIILTASGTIWMESAIRECAEEKVLCSTCGSFSERQMKVAERCGKDVDQLDYKWGKAVDPDDVANALEEDDYEAFTCVMNETSTGTRNPVEEIGEVLKDYPETSFIVDAISCLGGDYLDIDKSGIDVIFTSSQKAFALPPGLSICLVSDETYQKSKEIDDRGWYADFTRNLEYYYKKGQTHSTPAIPIMLAYRKQMGRMLEEGHRSRSERHRRMAEYTRKWALNHFDMFPEEGSWSQTVSTIENTRGLNIEEIRQTVKEDYNMIFSNGYGSKLKEKTFRIGHMGDHTVEDVKELTDAIEEVAGI